MTQATIRLSGATLARRLGPPAVPGDRTTAEPSYRQLADRLRAALLHGRVAAGTTLPSERELSAALGVSRTTVTAAYGHLRDAGFVSSRRGSGSILRWPDGGIGAATVPFDPQVRADPLAGSSPSATGDVIDLTTASLPAVGAALEGAVTAAAALLPRYAAGDGYAPFGLPVLRDAVAERYTRAGLPTTAEQILITNGAQHGFTIALGELSAPGDRVLIECPTYPVALDALRAGRRVPAPVAVDWQDDTEAATPAWDVELVETVLRQTAPRLGYLIPDFHNPTGALMDAADRERVAAAARRSGTVLVVDESFRDVGFGEADLPPSLAAFGQGTSIVCVGSVSKSLWGGLRIGWIRAAPGVIGRLAAAQALGDMAGPVLEQLVVAELLAEPRPALAVQRSRLRAGAEALTAALAAHLPDWRPSRPLGGTSLWVRLPGPFSTELARVAPGYGVRIAPGPRFGPDGSMESFLRLPFTRPADDLTRAVVRLAAAAEVASHATRATLPDWLA